MHVKVLGSGCRKCTALTKNVQAAAKAADMTATIEKVTDMVEIARYGVRSTPGLVIDEKVISTGKVLSKAQIAEYLATIKS